MALKQTLDRLFPSAEGRRTVMWLWVAGVALGFAGGHAINTEPLVRATFGISAGTMSAVFGVARTGSLLAILLTTRSDTRSRRRTFVASFGLAMVGSAATGATQSVGMYTLAQIVTRLAVSAGVIIGAVIAVESVTGSGRTYAVSLFGAAVSLGAGGATAALPLGDLSPEGWRWVFASSLIGLVAVPKLLGALPAESFSDDGPSTTWYASLTNKPDFWRLFVGSAAISVFGAVSVAFVIEHLVNNVGITAGRAAFVTLAGGTIGGLGFFGGSHMANRFGRKPTLNLAVVASTLGGIAVYQLSDLWAIGSAIAVGAFGSFAMAPSFGVLRNELFKPHVRSRAVTWVNNAGVLGSIIGLLSASRLIDTYGLAASISVLAVAPLIAILILWPVAETRWQGDEHMTQPAG